MGTLKLLVKKTSLLGENIFYLLKNGTPPSFVKPSGQTSGISVRGTVDLILIKIIFNYFNFYSINWSHVFFESPTILSPDPGTPRYFTVGRRYAASPSVEQRAEGMFPMASSSSSPPPSPIVLRTLPCRPVVLSRRKKPLPSPKSGRLAIAGAELRLTETGRWTRSYRRGGRFPCFSYNANNKSPSPSDKVMLSCFIS